jgi:hypothetical protein
MTTTVSFTIHGISPYSQSRPQLEDHLPGESHDDYRDRTWRAHLHVDKNGMVIIPPGAIKNCIDEAAKFMNIPIPGGGRRTYKARVEAGVACIQPVALGIQAKDVQGETLFLPADGRRGGKTRVWKKYPTLPEWGGLAELIILDETVLQSSRTSSNPVLQDIVEGAGQYVGLGRFRPANAGWYGRFEIEHFRVNR